MSRATPPGAPSQRFSAFLIRYNKLTVTPRSRSASRGAAARDGPSLSWGWACLRGLPVRRAEAAAPAARPPPRCSRRPLACCLIRDSTSLSAPSASFIPKESTNR